VTAIVLLAAGGHVRVHTTADDRIAVTILGSDQPDTLDIRLMLNADEATSLSAALATAALRLETPAA
jgi:hypothetical protein